MARYKLLALDFDGTILPYGGEAKLSPRLLQALRAAHNAGVVLCAATGRTHIEASPVFRIVPEFAYAALGNGSEVYRLPCELLESAVFSQSACDAIVEVLRQHPSSMVQACIGPVPYCEKHIIQDPHWRRTLSSFEKMTENAIACTPSFDVLFTEHGLPCKLFVVTHKAAESQQIAQAVQALGIAEVTCSAETNVEILPLGVNKASALRTICKHLGIAPHEVMAIGDSSNDLAMLSFAGLSVAMGNATDDVKAIAKEQTTSNTEDGVALAIERWLLTNEAVPCHP